MADHWIRVSRQSACPICGKHDNCSVSEDGNAVWCGRVSDGSVRQNGGGQFLHFRDGNEAVQGWTPPTKTAGKGRPRFDWQKHADEAFLHPEAAERRKQLAESLCVTEESLLALGVGWEAAGNWTFPERDEFGKAIGIVRRYPNDSKRVMVGGSRGFTYPDDWIDGDGPLLLPEGASCTAASLSMGLNAIGRPSMLSDVRPLIALLRQVPDGRQIIVVAENDRNAHDELSPQIQNRHKPDCGGCITCWPGWAGALKTAEQLRCELCRQIDLALPPENTKDVRAWLCLQAAD